jgi:hypothetical protein
MTTSVATMFADCQEHGTLPITGMGANTVTLSCGGVGSDGVFVHRNRFGDIVDLMAIGDEERALIHHVRGNCHNGAVCPLCQTSARMQQAELRLESVISGVVVPRMAAAKSPKPSLVDVVKAFNVAIPASQHGLKLKTIAWMRETVEIPGVESIRGYYDSIGGDWEAEAGGYPSETGDRSCE